MNLLALRKCTLGAPVACLLACLAVPIATCVAQTGAAPDFANPPLLYEGPDPTANYFLPSNSAMPPANGVSLPTPSTVTPLPPPEFSNAPQSGIPAGPPNTASPALTPSSILRRFMPPGMNRPDATRFDTSLSPTYGNPIGNAPLGVNPHGGPIADAEVVYPAEQFGEPSSFWPAEGAPIDPLAMHDGGLTENKDGFFQSLTVTGTWIDRNDKPDDFGITELDLKATFAVPFPTREWPLLLTPAFNTRFLDGPQVPNLPAQLYETYFDFTWVPRLSARWTAILGVAPSIYSDFEDSADGFRVTGKGLVRYDWRPGQVQVLLGVLYLGREDIALLPAGGVIWIPNDRQRYELLFPRPKLSHLIRREARYEDWLYLGAEFGGNSYSVERIPGTAETITLRDYRAYIGLERKLNGGAGFRLEIGYVAGRVIEFASGLPDVEADETAMIRGGITF